MLSGEAVQRAVLQGGANSIRRTGDASAQLAGLSLVDGRTLMERS
jgi:hypothetical protein